MGALFFTFVIMAIIESILSARWHAGYFQWGILIYSKSYPYGGTAGTPMGETALNEAFKKGLTSSLMFKEIAPNSFAFREKFFEFKFIDYTPIMRGRLDVDQLTRKIKVVGLINWWIIAFILTSIIFSGADFGITPFVILFLGFLFFIQKRKYDKVGEFAHEWNSRDWSRSN